MSPFSLYVDCIGGQRSHFPTLVSEPIGFRSLDLILWYMFLFLNMFLWLCIYYFMFVFFDFECSFINGKGWMKPLDIGLDGHFDRSLVENVHLDMSFNLIVDQTFNLWSYLMSWIRSWDIKNEVRKSREVRFWSRSDHEKPKNNIEKALVPTDGHMVHSDGSSRWLIVGQSSTRKLLAQSDDSHLVPMRTEHVQSGRSLYTPSSD